MLLRCLSYTCLVVALFACNSSQPGSRPGGKRTAATSDSAGKKATPLAANYFVERTDYFSDTRRPDRFRLELQGGPLLDSKVRFTIQDPDGQLIHEETFRATDLLSYAALDDTSAAGKEAFIRQRLDSFFAPSQFLRPAVKPGEQLQGDEERQPDWDEIRSDPSATGFSYLLGEEDGRRIAWSKKRKKVVLYYNCC
ncbi:hypothetical protein [Flaviaesturariibacter amylovorans]|uniref:Lipoprotein n=1 Tax=Flaviaesturariibacter amylovorans TaxID=1084520 RepID=A0ABP8HD91_9BACT